MKENYREVKIVYIDGNLYTGQTRSIRGMITDENIASITVARVDGKMIIGKNFIVKIEDWKSVEGYHGVKR